MVYRSFRITQFRGLDDVSVSDLKRVNLITGKNNSGKTTFLEAIFIHCGAYSPELVMRVNVFRGIEAMRISPVFPFDTPVNSVFTGFDTSKTVTLYGKFEDGEERTIRLRSGQASEDLARLRVVSPQGKVTHLATLETSQRSRILKLECEDSHGVSSFSLAVSPEGIQVEPVPPPPPFPAIFNSARTRVPSSEDAERFGNLEVVGDAGMVLNALKLLEPDLKRISVVVVGGVPMLHGDLGIGRLLPLPLMGEGMARLASLVLSIGSSRNGVVLIDEIENGIHYSVLPKVWEAIKSAARAYNVQVFATTHSYECVQAAHEVFSQDDEYDFQLLRLERSREKRVQAISYDKTTLEAAIESGFEVR